GRLPALSRAMAVTGGIWICWQRAPARLSEDFIRQAALEIGLIDDKRCEIDEAWSGLRLIWKPRGRAEKPRQRKSPPAAQAQVPESGRPARRAFHGDPAESAAILGNEIYVRRAQQLAVSQLHAGDAV